MEIIQTVEYRNSLITEIEKIMINTCLVTSIPVERLRIISRSTEIRYLSSLSHFDVSLVCLNCRHDECGVTSIDTSFRERQKVPMCAGVLNEKGEKCRTQMDIKKVH